MAESKTAAKSSGKAKTQPPKLCPSCRKEMVPVMLMPHRKMTWRHKFNFEEKCE